MGLDAIPPEFRLKLKREWERENTHPDFQYSQKWLQELDIDEQKRSKLINMLLNFSRCPKCGFSFSPYQRIDHCPKCGLSEPVMRELAEYEMKKKAQAKTNELFAGGSPVRKTLSETPMDLEEDRKKRVEILLKEEAEVDKLQIVNSYKIVNQKPFSPSPPKPVGETTLTYENIHHYHFSVPAEAYSIKEYRQKLNNARTLNEVEHILHDYYKHHRNT